jgi:predicted MPP superfamily phosphohydrolase
VRELAPAGADLVLAGHTHGGQWRLPLVGAFVLPSLYGRLYAEGFRVIGSTLLYTSRGAGVHTVPFRYRCPPEVTLFTLHRPRAIRAGNVPR